MTTKPQIYDLLDILTEAVLGQQDNLDEIIQQHDIPHDQIEGLADLIQKLHTVLGSQQPSGKFIKQLKRDLLRQNDQILAPLRNLRGRTQVAAGAAGIAAFAGLTLMIARRYLGASSSDGAEIPVLQQ
jgi:hypothetical protein